jgi:hypothetical protein
VLLRVLTVAVEILASLAFALFVVKLLMFAVEILALTVEMFEALIYCVVTVLILAVLMDAPILEKEDMYIVEKLPKLPTILLVVIDDATNDDVKSCE